MPRQTTAPADFPQAVLLQLAQLGQNIAIARKRRRESQAQWAKRLGVSQPTMGRIERGDPAVSMAYYAMCMWLINPSYALADLIAPQNDLHALEQEVSRVQHSPRKTAPQAPPRNPAKQAPHKLAQSQAPCPPTPSVMEQARMLLASQPRLPSAISPVHTERLNAAQRLGLLQSHNHTLQQALAPTEKIRKALEQLEPLKPATSQLKGDSE